MKYRNMIRAAIAVCATQQAFAASRVDGEQVYKDNCTRCHIAMHTYSPAMMKTITRHMGVRAMLTREEVNAVFDYLISGESSRDRVAAHSTSGRRHARSEASGSETSGSEP